MKEGVLALMLITAVASSWPCFQATEVCASSAGYRVVYNPYEAVDWNTWFRMKTQLHCHTTQSDGSFSPSQLIGLGRAAGYTALGISDHDILTWPWSIWGQDPVALGMVDIPNSELSAFHHMLAAFVATPITEYASVQEAIDKVLQHGGIPVLAHPWAQSRLGTPIYNYSDYDYWMGFAGIEIFNPWEDLNEYTINLWDRLLTNASPEKRVWGFAVDDFHSGLADSGWINVCVPQKTRDDLKESIRKGRFLAVRHGEALIESIKQMDRNLVIDTTEPVVWKANGLVTVKKTNILNLDELTPGYTYVRAEVGSGPTFTQPIFIQFEEPRIPITVTSSPEGMDAVKIDGATIRTPKTFTWMSGSAHTFEAFSSVTGLTGTRNVWLSWTDGGARSHTYTVPSRSETVMSLYKTQYYLDVVSPHGSPTPTSGWFDAEASILASVTSPWPGPVGTRYVCTGWTGAGSIPHSGVTSSVTFDVKSASNITWNWGSQHYLEVETFPEGIETILGEDWYNAFTEVSLSAPLVPDYTFFNWEVDYLPQAEGVMTVTVNMDVAHEAVAHYRLISPDANFSSSPRTSWVNEYIVFNASEGNDNYTWDFGDGNIATVLDRVMGHTYSSVGTYSVVLNVTKHGMWSASSSIITVTFLPDLNKDGTVDMTDISIVARAFRSGPDDPTWNALADLDKNGWITIRDFSIMAKDYGKIV